MLQINNRFIAYLGSMISTQGLSSPHIHSLMGNFVVAGALTVGVLFFGQIMALLAALFLIWALASWFIRMFELIFFSLILPITAAAAIGGYRHAWEWNVREIAAAIFTQSGQAFAWFLVLYILAHGFGNMWSNLVGFFLGVMGFFFIAKVPEYMQSLFGHQHAGGRSVAPGVAAGYIGGKVGIAAFRTTKGGQAMGMLSEHKAAGAKDKLLAGAGGKTLSERFKPGGKMAGASGYMGSIPGRMRSFSQRPAQGKDVFSKAGKGALNPLARVGAYATSKSIGAGQALSAPNVALGRKSEMWSAGTSRLQEMHHGMTDSGKAALQAHQDASVPEGESYLSRRREQVQSRVRRAAQNQGPPRVYR